MVCLTLKKRTHVHSPAITENSDKTFKLLKQRIFQKSVTFFEHKPKNYKKRVTPINLPPSLFTVNPRPPCFIGGARDGIRSQVLTSLIQFDQKSKSAKDAWTLYPYTWIYLVSRTVRKICECKVFSDCRLYQPEVNATHPWHGGQSHLHLTCLNQSSVDSPFGRWPCCSLLMVGKF